MKLRLPDRKEGRCGLLCKTISAKLTACLHRRKVRDAVSSVNENHALWKRRSGCYEKKQWKGSKVQ